MGKIPNLKLAPIALGLQQVSLEQLAKKYLFDGETTLEHNFRRVATAIANVEQTEEQRAYWAQRFFEMFENGAVGGGRIMASAGRKLVATLINCFVQPIGDSMTGEDDNGRPGIMVALAEAAETMRRGGGVGYNFSAIRPKGAHVRGTNSRAGGPLSYMDLFDSMCRTVESAGARRGAQMGILDISHPDIEEFITAKAKKGRWTNFNVSVAITDAFMAAADADGDWELVHERAPHPDAFPDAHQRADGSFVYRTVKARALLDLIDRTTHAYSEPGIIYIDRVNADNNLGYCERIYACNPCGEQQLPAYGCCDLGSQNLTRFVRDPFTPDAEFDIPAFGGSVKTMVRFLDNVLDATQWPLEKQREEAHSKRRIGQGYFGLGDAMMMLGIRYGSPESVRFTEEVTSAMRDAAYDASCDLAEERGAFPLFDAKQYLESAFAKRLPTYIRQRIAKVGIRNSHLLSIAPTGTMALTFGDNASNGIEPAFLLSYQRKIRQQDDSEIVVDVEDHAYRVYRAMGGDIENLPPAFVTTADLTPEDHLVVMAAAQRYVDSSISKTINCPEDITFEAFGAVYRRAYELGLKSVTTYRPSETRGAVLIDPNAGTKPKSAIDPDRRLTLKPSTDVAKGSLRWPSRPDTPDGVNGWTMTVNAPHGRFALTVNQYENGIVHPFECWVQGVEAPEGLPATAMVLSRVMRSQDRAWVLKHLDALKRTNGNAFHLRLPGASESITVGSATSAIAHLIEQRCRKLGYFDDETEKAPSPMLEAMTSRREPKTDGDGAQAWCVDIRNDGRGHDFCMFVKEATLPDGTRFPFSVWLAGSFPREWDGLMKLISIAMRHSDPKWIADVLKSLGDYSEHRGDFWAHLPGTPKQANWPSTIAYIAHLLLARYRTLGILDADHEPVRQGGLFAVEQTAVLALEPAKVGRGHKDCRECFGVRTVVKRDGCEYCEACSAIGACG